MALNSSASVAPSLLLDLRIAGDLQVRLLHRVAEGLLHRVAEHFGAHLRPVGLRDQLERHLARPEARHAHVARELLQPLVDLLLDVVRRQRHRDAPLQRSQVFHVGRHVRSFVVVGAKGGTRTLMPCGVRT